jgi:hypothetical protein
MRISGRRDNPDLPVRLRLHAMHPAGPNLDSVKTDPHSPRAPVRPVAARPTHQTVEIVGAVAQLGERRVRNAKVRGSIPLGSTNSVITIAHGENDHRVGGAGLVLRRYCR